MSNQIYIHHFASEYMCFGQSHSRPSYVVHRYGGLKCLESSVYTLKLTFEREAFIYKETGIYLRKFKQTFFYFTFYGGIYTEAYMCTVLLL